MGNFSVLKSSLLALSCIVGMSAYPAIAGDRLLGTGGVSQIEGAGGGGLTPWAMIAGYGTDAQIGGSAFYTHAKTRDDFELNTGGIAVGFYNRRELSVSQTKFELGNTVAKESIRLNTLGIKLRLFGDAIYDQDSWVPQVSAGALIKHNEDFDFVPKLVGAKDGTGVDYYLAASKLYLDAVFGRNVLLGATLIATKANQFGLLGFGGAREDNYTPQLELSAAYLVNKKLAIGAEYRMKPNNLRSPANAALFSGQNVVDLKEEDAFDLFVAYAPTKNVALTLAYVNLGNIATVAPVGANYGNQEGVYVSAQFGF